jgi:hypothetical protein
MHHLCTEQGEKNDKLLISTKRQTFFVQQFAFFAGGPFIEKRKRGEVENAVHSLSTFHFPPGPSEGKCQSEVISIIKLREFNIS